MDLSEKMSFRVTDPAPEPVVLTPEEAAIFKAMEEEEFRLKNVELQQMLSALEGGKPPQTRGVYIHTYLQYIHTYIHVVRVDVIYMCVYIYITLIQTSNRRCGSSGCELAQFRPTERISLAFVKIRYARNLILLA